MAGTDGVAFAPTSPLLATIGEEGLAIHIWRLDYDILLGAGPPADTRRYTNAKVVLVGDTSVGKSGLGLVLSGQEYVPTDSTHGRNVWTFDSQEAALPDAREETRETLLWDLAGQPGYRMIHQLHLNGVAVALVVFDARSETELMIERTGLGALLETPWVSPAFSTKTMSRSPILAR